MKIHEEDFHPIELEDKDILIGFIGIIPFNILKIHLEHYSAGVRMVIIRFVNMRDVSSSKVRLKIIIHTGFLSAL